MTVPHGRKILVQSKTNYYSRNEDDGFFFVMLDVEATRPGNVIADDFRSPLRLEDCAMEKYPSV